MSVVHDNLRNYTEHNCQIHVFTSTVGLTAITLGYSAVKKPHTYGELLQVETTPAIACNDAEIKSKTFIFLECKLVVRTMPIR